MKITQRDKILLVVLAIVFVVALAIVMPSVGVLDCRTELQNIATATEELNEKLAAELAELREMGINSSDAENVRQAQDHLDDKTKEKMEEAARIANSIMAYAETYNVDTQWINSLQYIGGVQSNNPEDRLLDFEDVTDTNKEENVEKVIVVGNSEYTITVAKRAIEFSDMENPKASLELDFTLTGLNQDHFGALILYLQQVAAKGSLHVTGVNYLTGEKTGTITMYALMTANSDLLTYADELERLNAPEEEGEEGE
ncbi:MAG: hypothetical protein J6Y74_02085 [Clostridia bacterium]|nr:hypothetical protein [Clostridia bacterium]